MTPWLKAWEDQAQLRPDAVAVTNRHGQRCTYRHLRDRAHAAEHRLRILGFDAGDRLMATIETKQSLDEIVVLLWACGLRRGVFYPDWSGFTKRQMEEWRLQDQVSPRVKMHSLTGHEEVFAMPGPGWHDMAVAWPERALESGNRHASPVVVRKISHSQLAHGVDQWVGATGLVKGDVVAWMEGGLSALSWLSIFSCLSTGAHLVHLSGNSDDEISRQCAAIDARWVVASPRWLSQAGLPWKRCPFGVLAPWGVMTPAQRWRWSERTRWLEVWSPAACGWWWGFQETKPTQRSEIYLDACTTHFPWKVDAAGGYLWVASGEGWMPVAMVSVEAGRTRLSLSAAPDRILRQQADAMARTVRTLPQVGAVSCGQEDGNGYVVILPRSENDNPNQILEDARKACISTTRDALEACIWSTVASVVPRDERGDLDGARWVRGLLAD